MAIINFLNCWRFGGESYWGRGSYAGINNIDCHEGIVHADYGIATYTRDAIDILSNYIDLIEWISYCDLGLSVGPAGISCLNGAHWRGYTYWGIATKI